MLQLDPADSGSFLGTGKNFLQSFILKSYQPSLVQTIDSERWCPHKGQNNGLGTVSIEITDRAGV